jgi:hypothetical protein
MFWHNQLSSLIHELSVSLQVRMKDAPGSFLVQPRVLPFVMAPGNDITDEVFMYLSQLGY